MSDIKLQVGQWYRRRDGEIVYCFAKNPVNVIYPYHLCCEDGTFETCTEDGDWCDEADNDDEDIIEHLPDCDSFKWVPAPPKLQLREGAWYERKDGEIVGPCKVDPEQPNKYGYKWHAGCWRYRDDGTNQLESDQWIIREVEPPQPKYRPFKNAEEFKPYRNCWWYRDDSDGRRYFPPQHYDDQHHGGVFFAYRFKTCFFEDGTPFGVLEDE